MCKQTVQFFPITEQMCGNLIFTAPRCPPCSFPALSPHSLSLPYHQPAVLFHTSGKLAYTLLCLQYPLPAIHPPLLLLPPNQPGQLLHLLQVPPEARAPTPTSPAHCRGSRPLPICAAACHEHASIRAHSSHCSGLLL